MASKLSDFLHKASSVVAIAGSVLVVVQQAIESAPPTVSPVVLGGLVFSAVLGAFGFGAKAADK